MATIVEENTVERVVIIKLTHEDHGVIIINKVYICDRQTFTNKVTILLFIYINRPVQYDSNCKQASNINIISLGRGIYNRP